MRGWSQTKEKKNSEVSRLRKNIEILFEWNYKLRELRELRELRKDYSVEELFEELANSMQQRL